jgi:hypothetical protein
MRRNELSKADRLSKLLRLLGLDMITVEQFWQSMRQYGLTDEDIDRFCRGGMNDERSNQDATRAAAPDRR